MIELKNGFMMGRPSYPMSGFKQRFKKSCIDLEKAADLYSKLQNYLALDGDSRAPGVYKGEWALFQPNGPAWWREVRWMPKLQEGWHRLTFKQFLELYRIMTF